MGISFGGLASGLDTGALIDALVGIERGRAAALARRQTDANQRKAVVQDITQGLKALSDAAEAMDEVDEIRAVSAATKSENVDVTQGDGALAGTYDLSIINLARAETSRSFAFASDAAGVFSAGGDLGITAGSDAEVVVSYTAGMSLTDLADAINESTAEASASVLFDGANYRLQITSKATGIENALSFTDTGGETGMTDVAAEVVAAENADFVLNGTSVSRASNIVTDAITGVTLELLAETVTTATITIAEDSETMRASMQTYVDAYNNVAAMLDRQLTLVGDAAPDGSLFGDRTLQMLQRQLNDVALTAYGPSSERLNDYGITTGQDGSLTIDATKFDAALAGGTDGLVGLLEGAGGLSESMVTFTETYTDSINGVLNAKEDAIDSFVDLLGDQIDRIDRKAENLQARLTREFASLETLMAQLQAQGAQIMSLFG